MCSQVWYQIETIIMYVSLKLPTRLMSLFYSYKTADEKYMSVGAIEPQFYE